METLRFMSDPTTQACPTCGASAHTLPFCQHDGTLLVSSFPIGDKYLVTETFGASGTSIVFGARHQILGKKVAVKILKPDLAQDTTSADRFLCAARLASQLSHENIVSISDVGRDSELDLLYLVMERLWGPTLAQRIQEQAPMPWQEVVPILLQLCRALEMAHAQGVVHQNLNPGNVVLEQTSSRANFVKLCDFGVGGVGGEDRVTSTSTVVGTPTSMSPEQIRAQEDHRTDLYALGVTAYEMLTGSLPHQAAMPIEMMVSETGLTPSDRLSTAELPAALESLIMRCLARDRDQRPTSAAEVAEVLLNIEQQGAKASLSQDLVGEMVGSYRVTELLAAGGFGLVYRAEHPIIGTQVAIKVLLPEVCIPEVVKRFIQEAKASSAIGVPNIPRYYDFGYLSDGRAFAVMEFCAGQTVEARLEHEGPLPLDLAACVTTQVASAMQAAHAVNIIHRDLKPPNIMLSQDDAGGLLVKVLDFGIAKVLLPEGSAKVTQVGLFMGTPSSCAPEQVLGAPIGPQADIYSLGAVTFEMLTGRPPFEGEIAEVMSAKTAREAPCLSDLCPYLAPVVVETVGRMLARNPKARFQSMEEVKQAVACWPLDDRPLDDTLAASAPQPSRSRLGLTLLLVLVLAAVAFAIIVASSQDQDTPNSSPGIKASSTSTPTPPAQPKESSAIALDPHLDAAPDLGTHHTVPKAASQIGIESEPTVPEAGASLTRIESEPTSSRKDGATRTTSSRKQKKKRRSSKRRRKQKEAVKKKSKKPPKDSDFIIVDPFAAGK